MSKTTINETPLSYELSTLGIHRAYADGDYLGPYLSADGDCYDYSIEGRAVEGDEELDAVKRAFANVGLDVSGLEDGVYVEAKSGWEMGE